MKLGQRIRNEREAQDISLRRFALMIGVGHTYLVDVENGRRNIGIENLCKIADGLGVKVSELTDEL
ncbi:helix-turn-helix domain-containing protein [Gordonibacter sp. An230]|uniref:helix-turn-helix domain-containing protein n=1 Tax=Gordonibacter sp. An230 TaxID=1965592 RepID=UPI001EF5BFA5|nr:helix-turn-helix transcriptional regulator [Gordonibacter sp. An230]